MKFADDGGKAEDGNLIRFIENTLAKNNMNKSKASKFLYFASSMLK